MKIYTEFYKLPEVASMSIGEARTIWAQFLERDRWLKFLRRLLIAPVALALWPLIRLLFPADSYFPMYAAVIVAMEMVLALDRPFQVFLFRRTFTQSLQPKLTEAQL